MATGPEAVVRTAEASDVPAVCAFGEEVVPLHYAPLIGEAAAAAQVRDWWSATSIAAAVGGGLVVVAAIDGRVVGVGQRGVSAGEHVIYKLYVRPEHRSFGLGVRLLDALVARMPPDADRVGVEHFAANARAGAFYEREGFVVERIEPSPSGDAALDVVWRFRRLRAR